MDQFDHSDDDGERERRRATRLPSDPQDARYPDAGIADGSVVAFTVAIIVRQEISVTVHPYPYAVHPHPYAVHPHPYVKLPRSDVIKTWDFWGLCHAYGFNMKLTGGGVIGIVELGGGYNLSDVEAFCREEGIPVPVIVDVSTDGTVNSPGGGDADMEVALDMQAAMIAYAAATRSKQATIRMYWGQDIATCVRAAAGDGCDTISISWGDDEAQWGRAAGDDMEAAALEAVTAGSVVFAAAGDNDSSDGGPTPANVDLPAGCPHVVGCGGTRLLHADNRTRGPETVWNDNPGQTNGEGTGGGYSTLFPPQAWQVNSVPGSGRMVPDVAANADPVTGMRVYLDGTWQIVGGTSAVAPFYAGLFASFGKKLGFVAPKLWANPGAFNLITQGNNGIYDAGPQPSATCGLGSPIGWALAKLFVK
jgi:kumamolisin